MSQQKSGPYGFATWLILNWDINAYFIAKLL